MRHVTKEMIKIYKITNMDFMGYIQHKSRYSYHHIIKREEKGKNCISNGAILLDKTSHDYLHVIEARDLEMYIYLNKILKEINNQGKLPSKNQIILMWNVLEQFEREHSGDSNKNGYPLIKEKYIRRNHNIILS